MAEPGLEPSAVQASTVTIWPQRQTRQLRQLSTVCCLSMALIYWFSWVSRYQNQTISESAAAWDDRRGSADYRNSLSLSLSGLAGIRMSPFWILLEHRVMEVVVTTGAKTCKALVKSSPPTNQHSAFYRPYALPVAQLTATKHWLPKL